MIRQCRFLEIEMAVVVPSDSRITSTASDLLEYPRTVKSVTVVTSPSVDLEQRAYARTLRETLFLLIGVGVVIRIVRLILPSPIWGDEAMLALNFLNRDYLGLTHFLDNGQVAPVLFLWVERFVVHSLGTADWALRLVPFIASTGGLLLVWDFARRTVSPLAAVLAVGILAVSVWPVSMAATVKPYAGDLFWSALLLSLAARWYNRPDRLWPLFGLVATVPIALASSYPAVFVAGGISLYLLVRARQERWLARGMFLLFNLAMLATFVLTYAMVGQAQIDPTAGTTGSFMMWYWRNGFPPDSILQVPLWFIECNTGRMFAYPIGDANWGSSLTTLIFLVGIWQCWRDGNRSLLAVCLVPFFLNLIAAFLGKYPYAGCCRLSQHLAPAICLLVGVGWASLLERFGFRRFEQVQLVRWAAGFLIVLGTVGLIYRCVKVDHDPVARFGSHLFNELNDELQPGDRIVIQDLSACDISTQWYLKRFGDRLIEVRPGEPLPQADRLWLISMASDDPPVEKHRQFLKRGEEWKAGGTFSYSVRPDASTGQNAWWFTTVTCMLHPDDMRPSPRLNVVP
jgi:hypothetical protein